jgi:predicted RNA-binding protein YlqC (UPF0109 family)
VSEAQGQAQGQADLAKVVETVGRVLADEPEDVRVVETEHRGMTLLELYMAPGDLGRAIGRQGRTAAAIRTLVSSAAERVGRRVQLEFRDGQPPE